MSGCDFKLVASLSAEKHYIPISNGVIVIRKVVVPSQCLKIMHPYLGPMHLLSLLDDVIPDWDLGVRKKGEEGGR